MSEDKSSAREAMTGEHEDFLSKPFSADTLVETVRRLLQTPAA